MHERVRLAAPLRRDRDERVEQLPLLAHVAVERLGRLLVRRPVADARGLPRVPALEEVGDVLRVEEPGDADEVHLLLADAAVEAVDPVFQTKMLDMLKQTGRPEMVVGWYHSHPGFGCWLSSVDINTQQFFEQLTPRAVAVVVDPIQSVKGKVVIDAFRLINPQTLMMGHEPRQTTSNVGHLNKPSIQALIHGLNRHYYSIGIDYRKSALEENMLMNLHKHVWTEALEMDNFNVEADRNQDRLTKLVSLAEGYEQRVKEETELTKDQLKTRYVGKVDPKKRMHHRPPYCIITC